MIVAMLAMFWLGTRERQGLGWWIGSELATALGIVSIPLRFVWPEPLAIALSNACLFASPVLTELGLRDAAGIGMRFDKRIGPAIALTAFAGLMAGYGAGAAFPTRVALFSAGLSLQGLWLLRLLASARRPVPPLAVWMLLGSIGLLVVANVHRSVAALLHANSPTFRDPLSSLPFQMVLLLFHGLSKACAVLVFIHARVADRLQLALAELGRQASVDGLTGVSTRSHFEAQVPLRLEKAARRSLACTLVVLDIDRFKLINDGGGHPAGDRKLEELGQALRAVLRAEDLCGRMGGDEFAVLLYDCDLLHAEQVVRRLRATLAGRRASAAGDAPVLTVSMGIAPISACDPFEEAFRRADEALYEAKRAGRDTWRTARVPNLAVAQTS